VWLAIDRVRFELLQARGHQPGDVARRAGIDHVTSGEVLDVAAHGLAGAVILFDAHRALQHLRRMADALSVVVSTLEYGFLAIADLWQAEFDAAGLGFNLPVAEFAEARRHMGDDRAPLRQIH